MSVLTPAVDSLASRLIHPASCLSLLDIPAADQEALVDRSVALACGEPPSTPLAGRCVGMLFTKTSTRTRTAFTVGSVRLGGFPIAYGPADLQTGTGESLADTGRVFGSMLDVLVVRTAGPHAEQVELATGAGIPVINAMSAPEHPTQGLCDLATLTAHGLVPGVRLVYVGEGNNTAVALAYALALVDGAEVTFATPSGYGLPDGVLERARTRAARAGITGAVLREVHDMTALPDRVDVIYTTRWQTTGTAKPDAAWRERFDAFRVRPELMARWPNARFMHDLPAHRGDEVAGEVLDGPRSLAWSQARMKLYGAMALLERAATMVAS
jgi:ornithine carbamoyltransferase/carbamoyltransferase